MFLRKNKLCERIVFLDGMWGTGKAILAPVLGSFEQVEKQILNYNFEYLCTIFFNDKEKEGNAEVLLQLMADVQLYDSVLSRNANFRMVIYLVFLIIHMHYAILKDYSNLMTNAL